jgi:acyl carrier protein
MNTIKDAIRRYIAENLIFSRNGYPYPDDASFLDEGIVDSTGIMELVTFVEDKLGVIVQDEELVPDNFDSVSRVAAFVCRKKQASGLQPEASI